MSEKFQETVTVVSQKQIGTGIYDLTISFASCNIGGTPIPPPIRNAFLPFSTVNPLPSGPIIFMVSPIHSLPHSATFSPTISYSGRPSIRRSWNSPLDGLDVLTRMKIPLFSSLHTSTNGLIPSVPRYGFTVAKSSLNVE
mgnify:CR=1 FL=1